MQFKLQHADSQTDDPHDVIVAQLRDLAPRLEHDPSELNVTSAEFPEQADEASLNAAPMHASSTATSAVMANEHGH